MTADSPSALDDHSAELPPVSWFGLLLGLSMGLISVTGLAWRLSPVTVTAALLVAFATSVALRRHFDLRGSLRSPTLVLLPLLILPALAAFAPPYTWDEVAYGAALPRDYARAGRFFYNADYGVFSAFPGNFEALTTASLVLFRTVVPAQWLTIAIALGLVASTIALCRSLRLGVGTPLLAGVFVLSAPALVEILGIVKNDTANAFFQVLFVVVFQRYLERPRTETAALGGFFLGTALGIKYISLFFVACALPVAAALLWLTGGLRGTKARHVLALMTVAAISAAPWYLRNLLLLGNPIFPLLNAAFGARNGFSSEHAAISRDMVHGIRDCSLANGTIGGFIRRFVDGFGVAAILLAVPSGFRALGDRRRTGALLLGAMLLVYGLLTFFFGLWMPRYVLLLLVPVAIFAAATVDEGLTFVQTRWGQRTAAVARGAVLVAAVATAAYTQVSLKLPIVRDVFALDTVTFAKIHAPFTDVALWLNSNATEADRIGIGINVQPFYYLERPYFHIHPMSEKGNLQAARTADELLQSFRALGLTMLVIRGWDYTHDLQPVVPGTTVHLQAFLDRFYGSLSVLRREGRIRKIRILPGLIIYRIETEPPRLAKK